MKHFYIISNTQKDPGFIKARELADYLRKKNAECVICGEEGRTEEEYGSFGDGRFSDDYRYTDARRIPEETECVLVLGGDGTLLQAARDLAGRPFLLFGINLGTLGYLAEVEYAHVKEALDRLLEDRYHVEDRMMLHGQAWHQGKLLLQDTSLNDIVISRSGKLRIIDFRVYVDEELLGTFSADGIIVSTPTGSTGYNLSAGGPIVAPHASLILLTAIAPHTLASRPIVLPDNVTICIEIGASHEQDSDGAQACFDGDTTISLSQGDRVEIRRSIEKTRFIRIRHTSFLETLREKMK